MVRHELYICDVKRCTARKDKQHPGLPFKWSMFLANGKEYVACEMHTRFIFRWFKDQWRQDRRAKKVKR